MENIQKIIDIVADCLEYETSEGLTAETKLNDLEGFDSLATLSISAAIKIKYGVNLSGLDIIECNNLQELYELIQEEL
ncbi:acyl carrier protein [Arcobacter porcinus]|uniref:acyl carrier protein n=1 Tax=Arcobacter porcinus TaxID=1935204 RepID=UPI00081EB27A|nr:acyl carrier protein [Arcobacter porcinus]OCL82732.1 Phosphopantetheine attachment site [Arcobacter porcinus]